MTEFEHHDHVEKCRSHHRHFGHRGHHGSALYFLGAIGAAVYFIQGSTGFWMGVLGALKGLVWPAFAVYKAFQMLQL